jgi:hypothetical protein
MIWVKWSCVARVRWNELGLEPQRGKIKKKVEKSPVWYLARFISGEARRNSS